MKTYEIIKFNQGETNIEINALKDEKTVWLSKEEIAKLFNRDRSVISKHIYNIYSKNELDEEATCAKNAQVHLEGNRKVKRNITYYNLDVILLIGYKINSNNGLLLKDFIENNTVKYSADIYDNSKIYF